MSYPNWPEQPKREDFDEEGEYLQALQEWEFFIKNGYWR